MRMRRCDFLAQGGDKEVQEMGPWRMKRPELLAPAGDFEKLRTALHYGADAVYIGDSRFSLRGKAGNFQGRGIEEVPCVRPRKRRKVYVTANIFAHNRDLPACRGTS